MKILVSVILAILAVSNAYENEGKRWALLVTGANTWYNYAGQSDISHAYQVVKRRGVPEENIIVMMYDDNAYDPQNPQPGVLINKPDGPNVHKDIKVDYNKEDITPENFLAVLTGNKEAVKGKGTGRVIESGPNDNVFVAFVGHGDSGIIVFLDDYLHSKDLIKALKQLTEQKRYGQLLIYHVSCFGGSMYKDLLPTNTKILASSAANDDETAKMCYCDYKNYPCLGSTYSVAWMEHVDKAIPKTESVGDQYKIVKEKTTDSHPTLYGDQSVKTSLAADFLGPKNLPAEGEDYVDESQFTTVSARDATLYYFRRMAKQGRNKLEKMMYAELADELVKNRKIVDEVFNVIVKEVTGDDEVMQNAIEGATNSLTEEGLDCQKKLYKYFNDKCLNIAKNTYVLGHLYKLANICQMSESTQEDAFNAIDNVCNGSFSILSTVY